MPINEQPETDINAHQRPISPHAIDWLRQFIKHFEQNFVDASTELSPKTDETTYHLVTARAVIESLRDSGLTTEIALQMLSQAAAVDDCDLTEWTPDLNKRRFVLIDKEIQGTILPLEQVELTHLTDAMRRQLDSELHLPMEGAKALHRKLTELPAPDELH